MFTRVLQQPLQPYRTAKAPFAPHGIRLRALRSVQDLGLWNPLEIWRAVDGDSVPGVNLVSLVWGAVFGHAAESTVLSGLLWLVLLCGCVALTSRRLGGSTQAAVAAGLFTAVLPCVHGAATVYYYDVPYLGLVWLATFLLLPRPGGRPILGGLGGGLAFVAACLAKWSALPLGLPFVAGALLCGSRRSRRERLWVGLAFTVTAVALLALVLSSSDASLQDTLRRQADPDAYEDSLFGLRAKMTDLRPRAAYLGAHFITSVLSPLLAVPLLLLGCLWLARDRRGLPLFVVAVSGVVAFSCFLAADEDERFVVPAATVLALAAALALDGIRTPRRARRIAAVVVGLGLLVAWDFHHADRAPWNTEVILFQVGGPEEARDPVRLRGLGAVSSIESLGWNRRDETPDVPNNLLRGLSAAFPGERSRRVLVTAAAEEVGVHSVWFEYQHLLASHLGAPRRPDFHPQSASPCGSDQRTADYLLMTTGEEWPSCLQRSHWQKDRRIEADGHSLTLLRRRAGQLGGP